MRPEVNSNRARISKAAVLHIPGKRLAVGPIMKRWILPDPEQPRGLRPYLLAVLFVAGAVLLRWAAPNILGTTPYLAFFPACVFAAILGGFWPGVLAFVSSWLSVRLLFDGVPLSDFYAPIMFGRFVVFLFGGVGVCLLAEYRLRSRIREREADLSVRYLGAIVECSEDAIIGKTLDGRITSWNEGAEHLYGYSAADVLGKSIAMLVPDGHTDDLAHILQRLASGQHVAPYETERKRKDGHIIQISLKVSPIMDASGAIVGASSIARDITERKRVEEALHESEERLSLAVQAADLGTWDWDIVADRLFWSPRCFALFGLSPDTQMTYERFLNALHPADRERIDCAVHTALDRHEEYMVEFRTVWPDGSLHWVVSRGKAFHDTSGKAVRMIGAAMDITERKRTEKSLIEVEKLASVGRMAATIAHEINNPLAAVMNLLFLVSADPGLPRNVRSHLDLAERELKLVAHITKQTLGFYKESATPTAVRLPEVLDQVLDIYGPRLRNNSVHVKRRYGSVCDVYGVGGEIRQIISNLVANSIDATPQNGTLHVRATGPVNLDGKRPTVALTIADTGSGIAPEHFKRVLEPFFTTKQSIGTGLGLWVTSELVDKNDGKMHIRSQLGKGTVVTIWLPVERRDAVRSIA